MAFKLPDLNYSYNDLEPFIDGKTMEIHHSKHHQGYTNNLNNAIEGTNLQGMGIIDLLKSMDMSNAALRNNGGGFYNHSLFWSIIGPNKGGTANGEISDELYVSGIDILYGWRPELQNGNYYMAHNSAFSESGLISLFQQKKFKPLIEECLLLVLLSWLYLLE